MSERRDVRVNLSWSQLGMMRAILRTNIERAEQSIRVYPDAERDGNIAKFAEDMKLLLAVLEGPVERLVAGMNRK